MPHQPEPDPTADAVNDAVEHALWQDLADAFNRLTGWGANPLLGLADRLGDGAITVLDPAEAHHTYRLRYQPPFGEARPDGRGDGWVVERRPDTN